MKTLRTLLLTVLALLATVVMAGAAETEFANPKQGKNALDYCLTWQKGCGQKAADAWCVKKGFENASDFAKAKGIGDETPTRTIGDNSVCDGNKCDGFESITCYKSTAKQLIYIDPVIDDVRLDWCFGWAKDCGKRAAQQFCKAEGYDKATDFSIAKGVGPTRVMSTGQMCDDPSCDGFASIKCVSE